ncbi:unnamed protein product [Hymenolepis diminuta]|uniref:Uncharacterized protein n=1 Tax=Hymenolepis diminuta TaxID=6216 RepID=A0A564Y978_HYMDI|nr:unnamed protein product [Hymenolepis diminuta]
MADRDINLLGLDCIGMVNVLETNMQNVTCTDVRIKEMMQRSASMFEVTLGKCTQATARLILEPGQIVRPVGKDQCLLQI